MARKNQWGALSERYAIPVMITLLETENPKFSDLSPQIGSYNTIENLLEDLEKEGLVTQRRVTIPYKTTYIDLTEHGREVALALEKAERIRRGELDSIEEQTDYEASSQEGNKVK